jgi:hypothetical protein
MIECDWATTRLVAPNHRPSASVGASSFNSHHFGALEPTGIFANYPNVPASQTTRVCTVVKEELKYRSPLHNMILTQMKPAAGY